MHVGISNYKSNKKAKSIKICKMYTGKYVRFWSVICILKPMVCITSLTDLLYLIRTSCRWIILIKKNLFLHIWPFCFTIRLHNCLQLCTRKIFSFTCCSRISKKLCSNTLTEQCRTQSYVVFHIINYGILHFQCKGKD